jgi:phosphatidylglycerophosphatase A
VLKPFPVGYLDKNLKGGTGIVLDDVAAGIISNIILHALVYFMPGLISGS